MFIIRENDNNKLKLTRTEDLVEAIIQLASTNNPAELFEKDKGLNAKRIGFVNLKDELQ